MVTTLTIMLVSLSQTLSELFYVANYDWLFVTITKVHYFFFITHNMSNSCSKVYNTSIIATLILT